MQYVCILNIFWGKGSCHTNLCLGEGSVYTDNKNLQLNKTPDAPSPIPHALSTVCCLITKGYISLTLLSL